MKIPGAETGKLPDITDAYIINPYPEKKLLTMEEALDSVSRLAGMLKIDLKNRKQSAEVMPKCPTG